MRNPLKRALLRLRHEPFEGRWTPRLVDSYDLMIGAHERMQADLHARRKKRPSV
jgi:hypothetical protein